MKRLILIYRGEENGRRRIYRINVPEPIENIDIAELTQDIQTLKLLGLVPDDFEPDEARVIENNVNVLVNLTE
ncbi:MAG: DUF2922 domain-containing protein [Fervidobacterium sp.]